MGNIVNGAFIAVTATTGPVGWSILAARYAAKALVNVGNRIHSKIVKDGLPFGLFGQKGHKEEIENGVPFLYTPSYYEKHKAREDFYRQELESKGAKFAGFRATLKAWADYLPFGNRKRETEEAIVQKRIEETEKEINESRGNLKETLKRNQEKANRNLEKRNRNISAIVFNSDTYNEIINYILEHKVDISDKEKMDTIIRRIVSNSAIKSEGGQAFDVADSELKTRERRNELVEKTKRGFEQVEDIEDMKKIDVDKDTGDISAITIDQRVQSYYDHLNHFNFAAKIILACGLRGFSQMGIEHFLLNGGSHVAEKVIGEDAEEATKTALSEKTKQISEEVGSSAERKISIRDSRFFDPREYAYAFSGTALDSIHEASESTRTKLTKGKGTLKSRNSLSRGDESLESLLKDVLAEEKDEKTRDIFS